MNVNVTRVALINPIVPDGEYPGTMNGYTVKFSVNHVVYELTVDKGLRGWKSVIVTVNNSRVTIKGLEV